MLLICLLAAPVAAQPDLVCGCSEPIIALVAATILVGKHVGTFSGMLIGPSMGISSVLWLVMRNDAAIEPKWSWL